MSGLKHVARPVVEVQGPWACQACVHFDLAGHMAAVTISKTGRSSSRTPLITLPYHPPGPINFALLLSLQQGEHQARQLACLPVLSCQIAVQPVKSGVGTC